MATRSGASLPTGIVKYSKGKGFESSYNPPGVLRYNIVVTLDEPLANGLHEVKVYFNGSHPYYDTLQKGDAVEVLGADTRSPKLQALPVYQHLRHEPSQAPYEQTQTSRTSTKETKKARNKYDVIPTAVSDCKASVDSVSDVMEQCVRKAGSIRVAVYGVMQELSAYEKLEYDRALAVTIFIKATEGKDLIPNVKTTEPVPSVEPTPTSVPVDESIPY